MILVGRTIENAAQETVWHGAGKDKKLVPKYSMDQLLDPDFRLPRPPTAEERERAAVESFKAMFGVIKAKKKEE